MSRLTSSSSCSRWRPLLPPRLFTRPWTGALDGPPSPSCYPATGLTPACPPTSPHPRKGKPLTSASVPRILSTATQYGHSRVAGVDNRETLSTSATACYWSQEILVSQEPFEFSYSSTLTETIISMHPQKFLLGSSCYTVNPCISKTLQRYLYTLFALIRSLSQNMPIK